MYRMYSLWTSRLESNFSVNMNADLVSSPGKREKYFKSTLELIIFILSIVWNIHHLNNIYFIMNSNLPLLFANGFPTSIDNITQTQLQTFIPFLVQCSLGHDTAKILTFPKWWPENIPMITPNTKPICNEVEWLNLLKEIVLKCYRFHNCEYLVTFCNDLTKYHHSNLRYINNFNGTTSLYVKGKGRLLCTFRNENIIYDKKEDGSRKCLKPRIINAIKILDDEEDNEMVTTEAVDIYVCESCSAELESLSDMQEHEQICGVPKETQRALVNDISKQDQSNFMNYFELISSSNYIPKYPMPQLSPVKYATNPTRRTRGHCDLKKNKNIPFSSPAGKLLLKHANLDIDENARKEKFVKLEKMCPAPNINSEIPKFMNANNKNSKIYKVTYRKKVTYERHYQFPIGHFLVKCNEKSFKLLSKTKSEISPQMILANNKQETNESVIDLCSSDEEQSNNIIHIGNRHFDLLNSDKSCQESKSYIMKCNNSHANIPPISISIENTPVCKITQILYTENGIMQSSDNFRNDNTDNECINLCSSDEETILPDIPNYPHLTMMRIPMGSSVLS